MHSTRPVKPKLEGCNVVRIYYTFERCQASLANLRQGRKTAPSAGRVWVSTDFSTPPPPPPAVARRQKAVSRPKQQVLRDLSLVTVLRATGSHTPSDFATVTFGPAPRSTRAELPTASVQRGGTNQEAKSERGLEFTSGPSALRGTPLQPLHGTATTAKFVTVCAIGALFDSSAAPVLPQPQLHVPQSALRRNADTAGLLLWSGTSDHKSSVAVATAQPRRAHVSNEDPPK